MSSAQTQTRAQPPDHHVDEDVDADAAIDEEDITLRCCAPVYALTAPVEVGEIGFVDPLLLLLLLLLESFWPLDPVNSHVLVLSPNAEVTPQFFHCKRKLAPRLAY